MANRTLVGKMLISPSSLDTAFAERIMTPGRSPCIIDEERFEVSHHYFLFLILLTISHHLRWCTPDANDARFIAGEHLCSILFDYLRQFRRARRADSNRRTILITSWISNPLLVVGCSVVDSHQIDGAQAYTEVLHKRP